MQSKGYICTCPVVLRRFVDICQQVFGLFFTYDTTCNLLAGICNHQRKRVWLGGGAIAARGVAFHMPWGRGGWEAGPPHPTPPHPQGYASSGAAWYLLRLIVSTEG